METATTNFVKKFHITYRIVDNIKLRGVALRRRPLQQVVDSISICFVCTRQAEFVQYFTKKNRLNFKKKVDLFLAITLFATFCCYVKLIVRFVYFSFKQSDWKVTVC